LRTADNQIYDITDHSPSCIARLSVSLDSSGKRNRVVVEAVRVAVMEKAAYVVGAADHVNATFADIVTAALDRVKGQARRRRRGCRALRRTGADMGEGGEKGREMIRIQGSSPSHDMQIRCLAGELAPRICFCGKEL
jgi:hypothetical protein